ncbi:MAG: amino acid adenylation domain-containing protein, partial [Bradymonadaceae bacterium]
GHSLAAVRIQHDIAEQLEANVPLKVFFDHPTVGELADYLADGSGGDVERLGDHDYGDEAPLSAEQRRLWFLQSVHPGSVAYQVPCAIRLEGKVDRKALQAAFERIAARHEILRARFPERDGEPVQAIDSDVDLDWQFEDLRDEAAEQVVRARVDEAVAEPFELEAETPLRVRVWRVEESEYVLLALFHHIAIDEWTMGVMLEELGELYTAEIDGRVPETAELPVQYADYAIWRNEQLESETFEEALEFWCDHLEGAREGIDWPVGEEPTGQQHPAESVAFEWGIEMTEVIRELAEERRTSLFVALYALFAGFLSRYAGQRDVTVGLPVTLRDRPELQELIGFFLNTLPMRTEIGADESFEQWFDEVDSQWRDARTHQWIPLEEIVEAVGAERRAGQLPLFDVMFTYLPDEQWEGRFGEASYEHYEVGGAPEAKCALNASMTRRAGKLVGEFEYDAARFERDDIEGMVEAFERFVERCLEAPERPLAGHRLLEDEPYERHVDEWARGPETEVADEPVHRLFERQAEVHPERVALSFGQGEWTYAELNRRANRLAHRLLEWGVGPEVPVGVSVERSPELIASLLGVMKAGGAYVALEPRLPEERLTYMVSDAGVEVVVCDEAGERAADWKSRRLLEVTEAWTSDLEESNPEIDVEGDQLAYVLYTSGTTGRPKGVQMRHAALRNHTDWMQAAYPIEPEDVVCQKTPYGFDASVWEIWSPLVAGAVLCVPPSGAERDPGRLKEGLVESQTTLLQCTPTQLSMLTEHLEVGDVTTVRRVFSGGEALPGDLARRVEELFGADLVNLYGPSETCIDTTSFRVDGEWERVPIGSAISNVSCYLLDDYLEPTVRKNRGELYISGEGLGRGYVQKSGRTAEAFVPDPYASQPGQRMYRTGDVASWNRHGHLEYRGRADDQLQVRGVRVEIGEIEAHLESAPGVSRGAVRPVDEEAGRADQLIGYLVADQEAGEPSPSAIRDYLVDRLTREVVPNRYVVLDQLPATESGKLDRSELPGPDQVLRSKERIPPRNETEKKLADIWRQHLELEEVGVYENFFEIGGDSIKATRVASRAEQAGVFVDSRDLIDHQTIAELSRAARSRRPTLARQETLAERAPLTPIQRWFFDQEFDNSDHWNQAFLFELDARAEPAPIRQVVADLIEVHDALRFRYERTDRGWIQRYTRPTDEVPFEEIDVADEDHDREIERMKVATARLQASLDLEQGPILRAGYFQCDSDRCPHLLIAIHHLAVDTVSWRILREHFELAASARLEGRTPELPAKTTSYGAWAQTLLDQAESDAFRDEAGYWRERCTGAERFELPTDFERTDGANSVESTGVVELTREAESTDSLLEAAEEAYSLRTEEVLLAALGRILREWTGQTAPIVEAEGHGRETGRIDERVDLSRTVGWFTTKFPLVLEIGGADWPREVLMRIKEVRRAVPHNGLVWQVYRHLRQEAIARGDIGSDVVWNYLGEFRSGAVTDLSDEETVVRDATEASEACLGPTNQRPCLLGVRAAIEDGSLSVRWEYSRRRHTRETIRHWVDRFEQALDEIRDHCRNKEVGERTAADFDTVDAQDFAEIAKSISDES